MTKAAEEFIDKNAFGYGKTMIGTDDALKAVFIGRQEFAMEIIDMIDNYKKQHSKGDIADYVKAYCEGYSGYVKD